MLAIRLQRTGRKHEPTFRVVLTDSKNGPKSGNFQEILGSYDAREKERATIKADRIKYWIANGAQVSDTVYNVLVDQGVVEGRKKNALPKKTAPVKVAEEEKVDETPAKKTQEEDVSEEKVEEKSEESKEDAPSEETQDKEKQEDTPEESVSKEDKV